MHRHRAIALTLGCAAAALPLSASAQSPASNASSDVRARPMLTRDGAAVTDVIDALDPGSAWSFRFSAAYEREQHSAPIQRERSTITSDSSDTLSPEGTTARDNVARWTHVQQTLDLRLDLALYRDLALLVRLPVILSDTRELTPYGGDVTTAQSSRRLLDGFSYNGAGTSLFSVPFRSPERSGIDQLWLGFSANLLNQARDHWLPTWLLRFEVGIPVGAPLRPCAVDANGASVCPSVSSSVVSGDPAVQANYYDPNNPLALTPAGAMAYHQVDSSGAPLGTRAGETNANPGISRNVYTLKLTTIVSRRYGYVEPYAGLEAVLELPAAGSLFRFGNEPFGQTVSIPPVRGTLIAGAEIVPWENRESWQRVAFDARVRGTYLSPGRDYSPLFDALGTSNSAPLSTPGYPITDRGNYNDANRVFFNGLTDVQAHAQFVASLSASFQAAKFLKFSLGGSVGYETPHLITATDACNPNARAADAALVPAERGGCSGRASPDPTSRTVIDSPGQRFATDGGILWGIHVGITLTPRF